MDALALKKQVTDLVYTKYCIFLCKIRFTYTSWIWGHEESLKASVEFLTTLLHARSETAYTL